MQVNFKGFAVAAMVSVLLTSCAAGSPENNVSNEAAGISPAVSSSESFPTQSLDSIAREEKQILRDDAQQAKRDALKAAEKAEEPAPVENTVAPSMPLALTSNENSVLPGESGFQWMDRMQRKFGVYAYPGTQFFIAPATPCQHFAPQALGCTEQILDSVTHQPWHQNIKLHMAESAIGNLYVLFHEIGHTQGIMDECQADIYSRNITGIPGGFYC